MPSRPGRHEDERRLSKKRARSSNTSRVSRRVLVAKVYIRTIAAVKAFNARFVNERTDQRVIDVLDRRIEGYRKAGMPET
jgi:hypothetical protein